MSFKEFLKESEEHIIMQLRSAQDMDGDQEINFRRGSAKVDKKYIDAVLAFHDELEKPVDKRKLRVAIARSAEDLVKFAKELM